MTLTTLTTSSLLPRLRTATNKKIGLMFGQSDFFAYLCAQDMFTMINTFDCNVFIVINTFE